MLMPNGTRPKITARLRRLKTRIAIARKLIFVVVALFVFLSPELNVSRETLAAASNVSRETFAAKPPTEAQVSQSLTCQCGCGLTVANCNMPTCSFSVPLRAEIDQMIGKGMSGPQIISFYRHKFGEKVLSAPTTEGFNLLAWTMPFIAIVVGGGLIVLAFGRWRSVAPTPAPATPASDAIAFDPVLRRRLEDELKERG